MNQLRKVKSVLEKHSPAARSFRFVVQVELIKRAVERNQAIKTHTLAEHGSRMRRRGREEKKRRRNCDTKRRDPQRSLEPQQRTRRDGGEERGALG